MNEQLRFHTGTVAIERPLSATTSARRLDTRTLEIGRRGVAQAREILASHRQFDQNPTSPTRIPRIA